jgi:hypothetical protein
MITHRQAAEKMSVTDRWVRVLLTRLKREGDRIVKHGLAGRISNRRIDEKTQSEVMKILVQPDWHDFGPTFAAEQLAKIHGIQVSKETARGWMIAGGLWKSGSRRNQDIHCCWRQSAVAMAN